MFKDGELGGGDTGDGVGRVEVALNLIGRSGLRGGVRKESSEAQEDSWEREVGDFWGEVWQLRGTLGYYSARLRIGRGGLAEDLRFDIGLGRGTVDGYNTKIAVIFLEEESAWVNSCIHVGRWKTVGAGLR